MYLAVSPSDSYYASTRDGITVFLLILIPLSVAYYVAALVLDLVMQFKTRREANARVRKPDSKSGRPAVSSRSAVRRGTKMGVDILRDDVPADAESDNGGSLNPLFFKVDGTTAGGSADDIVLALREQAEPPSQTAWLMYRAQYASTMKLLKTKTEQFAGLRQRTARLSHDLSR
ncbi:MAG: hypothetical protein EOO65_04555 [Methanosarcinales archaeon]|nr:MAG: hypothetical protein EOO65_04555 [Methanosarcinales archaeon]